MSDSTQADNINTLGFASVTKELESNFKQVEEIMGDFAKTYEDMKLDPFNLSQLYAEWFAAASQNPEKMIQANMNYWQKSMELAQQTMMGFAGQKAEKPVVEVPRGDRRFKHDDWAENPAFDVIKQSYLLTSEWTRNLVSDTEGLDDHTNERVKFFTERTMDAMSPTNFAMSNPAVLEKIKETKGANLVHGLKNMLEDLEAGDGELRIRMTDTEAFELGKNVGATPGKVVFQNRMFQLIQYTPTTEKVLKRPLLMVPPCINKFYILDLQPKNSWLKWLTDQGHTVYVISWVNPDETYADTGFEDYITEGVLTAVDAVEYDTGESEINAVSYCIGGTLLSTSLAVMKSKGDDRIKSATFFTTMLDFSEPGELGLFIDDEQITSLEEEMSEKGYLEGTKMAGAFNLLRANDLIWSFYVNNYLLGNDPRPFDLLYWNSDSTRLPAKMHSWYLRNLYQGNKLCQPQALSIDGEEIDLTKIDVPSCFISTVDDHIAPWTSTYMGARLLPEARFILGGSGHIAGIINPPAANKYGYKTTKGPLPDTAEAWLESAEQNEGSWWPEWDSWVRTQSDEQVAARVPGEGNLAALEDAPGTYVKCTMKDPTPKLEVTQLPEKKAVAAPAPKRKAPVRKPAAAKKPAAPKKPAAKKPAAKKPAPKKD
uniref:Polyhydroxyalkanoic acid synthase n=1 Tax=uncultured Thiotrichaceae bacterium TaxID=298394 RepID=A0A6S6U7A5_9GAMM|nr:MAG: Polyhydroxyalkanoic acid synthase [uncultured Thiotrichaceae bacterium]